MRTPRLISSRVAARNCSGPSQHPRARPSRCMSQYHGLASFEWPVVLSSCPLGTKRGPGDHAVVDGTRHRRVDVVRAARADRAGEAGVERHAQVVGGEQRLVRGRVLEAVGRRGRAELAVRGVEVARDHARHHRAAADVDDAVVGRDVDRRVGGHADDAIAVDRDRATRLRRVVAVEQRGIGQDRAAHGGPPASGAVRSDRILTHSGVAVDTAARRCRHEDRDPGPNPAVVKLLALLGGAGGLGLLALAGCGSGSDSASAGGAARARAASPPPRRPRARRRQPPRPRATRP